VVEEYRMSGEATAYASPGGGRPDPSGRWGAEAIEAARYRTRLLVVRPADPALFNGTVVLNWQNVSAGAEPPAPDAGEVLEGYAWVGVSAQEGGLYGRTDGWRGGRGGVDWGGPPLLVADPERYGDLHHPGDQGSFDIFAQAAQAVRAGDAGPLAGLPVRRVLAAGASQSAMRLAAFANALHHRYGVIDGYLLSVWEGRAPRLEEGAVGVGVRTALRDDLGVPVLVVNSEFEAPALQAAGVVDGPARRIWEVAGAPHAPGRPPTGVPRTGWGPNPLSLRPVWDAALLALRRWCEAGDPAPAQPRLVMTDGTPPRLARDASGNALGGIRLPELAAPVGEYRGIAFGTGRPPMSGAFRAFSS
jgi:hypothetical protein